MRSSRTFCTTGAILSIDGAIPLRRSTKRISGSSRDRRSMARCYIAIAPTAKTLVSGNDARYGFICVNIVALNNHLHVRFAPKATIQGMSSKWRDGPGAVILLCGKVSEIQRRKFAIGRRPRLT